MLIAALKLLHVAMIAIWASGLLALPFLFRQRADVTDRDALLRMHARMRFLYVVVLSPAAFVAIGSGTALIFARQTFDVWFSVKLVLVGGLVGIHLLSGIVLLGLFDESGRYASRRHRAFNVATFSVVLAILAVVLAKPTIEPRPAEGRLAAWFEPGALGARLAPFIRRLTP